MAENCSVEVSGLPVLFNCPEDNEYVLFIGAQGGYSQHGYALRSWAKVKECLGVAPAPIIVPAIIQVITADNVTGYHVDAPGSEPIIYDSLWISLSGSELARGLIDERVTYSPTYNPDGSVDVEFFNDGGPLPENQPLIFHFLYQLTAV
jgi:hypothetical protein